VFKEVVIIDRSRFFIGIAFAFRIAKRGDGFRVPSEAWPMRELELEDHRQSTQEYDDLADQLLQIRGARLDAKEDGAKRGLVTLTNCKVVLSGQATGFENRWNELLKIMMLHEFKPRNGKWDVLLRRDSSGGRVHEYEVGLPG
jgi:hypothetical protein